MTQKAALIADITGQDATYLSQLLLVSRRSPSGVTYLLHCYPWRDDAVEMAGVQGASSDWLSHQKARGICA